MNRNNLNFKRLYDQLVNLARILHQENILLLKHNIRQIMPMQKQKNIILEEVNKFKENIKNLDKQDMSNNIKEVVDEINRVSESNLEIIEKDIIINKKIMKLMIYDPPVKLYGQHGLIIEDSYPITVKDLI